jgi:hypothetical protein
MVLLIVVFVASAGIVLAVDIVVADKKINSCCCCCRCWVSLFLSACQFVCFVRLFCLNCLLPCVCCVLLTVSLALCFQRYVVVNINQTVLNVKMFQCLLLGSFSILCCV